MTNSKFNFGAYLQSEERTNRAVHHSLFNADFGAYDMVLEEVTAQGFIFSNDTYKHQVKFKSAKHADLFIDQLILQNGFKTWGQVKPGAHITLYVTPWTKDSGEIGKAISPFQAFNATTLTQDQSSDEEIL